MSQEKWEVKCKMCLFMGGCMGTNAWGFASPYTHRGQQRMPQILLCNSHPYPLRQSLSLNLNLELDWWQQAPTIFLTLVYPCQDTGGYMDVWHNPAFPVDSEDLNLGPSVCIARALTLCFIFPVSSNIKFLLLVLFHLSPKEGQEQTARTSQPAPHREQEKEERRE